MYIGFLLLVSVLIPGLQTFKRKSRRGPGAVPCKSVGKLAYMFYFVIASLNVVHTDASFT